MCLPAEMHSRGLVRTLSCGPRLTARPNELKVQFLHTPREAAAGPMQGRGHRAGSTTASPQRWCYSQHHPYCLRRGKATESPYLNDPAGRRHLAAHHDPREGQLPGPWRAAAITGVLGGWGRALPVTSRRRSGRSGETLLHCGASPTHLCLTPPLLSSCLGTDPGVSHCFVLQTKVCGIVFILFTGL